MKNPTPRLRATLIACLCLLLLPALGSAQDASSYLQKMLEMYEQPFKAQYTMTMAMNQGGMQMSMEGKGDMTYADPTHMLMDMQMTMKIPNMEQEMTMAMKSISDGTYTWTEMDNPMMGKQVMKMDIAKAQEMATSRGMTANAGSSPLEQLRSLQEYYDFTIADQSGGSVTMVGTLKESAPEQMRQAGPMVESMKVVLDESTSRLERFEMGPAGEPVMVMTLDGYEALSSSDVPDSLFSYTPPEGVQVVDPLAMGQGQGPQ